MIKQISSLVILCGSLLACGGGGDDGGIVYFKIDAGTCRIGATSLQLFINGSLVGTELIAAGGVSSGFPTHAGSNVLFAKENKQGGYIWNPSVHIIPEGGSYTLILPCI